MPTVLLMTYGFPPEPLATSMRVAKICKYLPRVSHWLPVVVCGEVVDERGYDHHLLDAIPAAVKVHRVGCFLSSRFCKVARRLGVYKPIGAFRKLYRLPDAMGDWIPRAVSTAERLYPGGAGLHAVLASGPPRSVYVAAHRLARKWNLPYVMDMRDQWVPRIGWTAVTPWHDRSLRRAEEICCRAANCIIANTPGNASEIAARFPWASSRIRMIPNGYDPEDLDPARGPRLRQSDGDGLIHLLYLGGFRGRATRTGVFEEPLFRAVSKYGKRDPRGGQRLRLHFVGAADHEVRPHAERWGLWPLCRCHGFVPANQVGRPLAEADVCVVVMAEDEKDSGTIPSKVYDYLGANRPIWGLLPSGTARQLLATYPKAACARPGDVEESVRSLEAAIEMATALGDRPRADSGEGKSRAAAYGTLWDGTARFDRKLIARDVAAILDEATSTEAPG